MGPIKYWWMVVQVAFRHSFDLGQKIVFPLFLATGLAVWLVPKERLPFGDKLMAAIDGWQAVALACLLVFVARLGLAPYWIWKEQKALIGNAPNPGRPADLKIGDLFHAIDPGLVDADDQRWLDVGREVKDRLSIGDLRAWGRKAESGDLFHKVADQPLMEIPSEYWGMVTLSYQFLGPDSDLADHTYSAVGFAAAMPGTYRGKMADVRVMRSEAEKIWPQISSNLKD